MVPSPRTRSLGARRIPGTRVALRARHALIGAGLCVGLLVLCWFIAFHSVTVARADAHAYFAFLGLTQHHAGLRRLAADIGTLGNPTPYVYLAAIPVIVALLRRRWVLALAIVVMIPGALLTSELLKPLLYAPRPATGVPATPIGASGSWPSGHATASMVLGLALVIASPARWRPWAAVVGSAFALLVAYAVLSLGWHYPSDILGGILVALTWTLLAVAGVLAADARFGRDLAQLSVEPRRWLSQVPALGALLGASALAGLAMLVWRGQAAIRYAGDHGAFLAAVLGVLVAGVLAPTLLAYVLSGSGRAATAARSPRWPRG